MNPTLTNGPGLLARLGAEALRILESSADWDCDTADSIAQVAIDLGLGSADGDGGGMFKVTPGLLQAEAIAFPGSAPVTPPAPSEAVAEAPATEAPPVVKPSFPPPSAKARAHARTALAATLGLNTRELSNYSYQPGRFRPALYCVGGSFWAVGKTKPTADVGHPWEKARDQFWAEKAGTVVWESKEILKTRSELKKRGAR